MQRGGGRTSNKMVLVGREAEPRAKGKRQNLKQDGVKKGARQNLAQRERGRTSNKMVLVGREAEPQARWCLYRMVDQDVVGS